MKVCVQGLWHLGTVTTACLASVGHDVSGLDLDSDSIKDLSNARSPIFEPGLNELLEKGISCKKLKFFSLPELATVDAEVLWVTYDTPVDDDDRADTCFVINQIRDALKFLADGAIILVSSQIPVGSIRDLESYSKNHFPEKNFNFAYSPENLRLGKAIDAFLKPDRIVIGTRNENTREILTRLFLPICVNIEWMSVESAEVTKHAINAFLATSVTYANEIAIICEAVGADAREVERGLKSEARIGVRAYVSPGGPFAGGTLARDVEFLIGQSAKHNLRTPLLSAVRQSNGEHKNWVRRKLQSQFRDLSVVTVAIWGLTYKPHTDTLRRSLAVELCEWLVEYGANVQVFDPAVKNLPHEISDKLKSCTSALEAVAGAHVLVVGTEWPQFRQTARELTQHVCLPFTVIDPNRFLDNELSRSNFTYLAVGTNPLRSVD